MKTPTEGRTGAFAREFLARVVARFRETHASSGEVGGAEARVVLSERTRGGC